MFLYVYIAEVEQLFSCREVIINCHLNIFLEHVLKSKLTYILNCKKSQSKTSLFFELPLHKKWSFPLWISSVIVTKYAVYCGFGRIYWRNS